MESECAYGDCKGSPKHSCECNRKQKFCDDHIYRHKHKATNEDGDILKAAHDQFANVTATMSKVMMTGREMFEEICRKLCEITNDLTHRQSELLKIASNVEASENVTINTVKKIGDTGLTLRGSKEFKSLIDQHFSQEGATIDFTLFSEDFKKMIDSLKDSNSIIEEVKEMTSRESEEKKIIQARLESLQIENQSIRSELYIEIESLKQKLNHHETNFSSKENLDNLKEQVGFMKNKIFDEIDQKFSFLSYGIASQASISEMHASYLHQHKNESETNSKRLEENLNQQNVLITKEFNSKIEKLTDQFNTLTDNFQKNSNSINQNIQDTFNIVQAKLDTQENQIKGEYNEKFNNCKKSIENYNIILDEKINQLKQNLDDENYKIQSRFESQKDELKKEINQRITDFAVHTNESHRKLEHAIWSLQGSTQQNFINTENSFTENHQILNIKITDLSENVTKQYSDFNKFQDQQTRELSRFEENLNQRLREEVYSIPIIKEQKERLDRRAGKMNLAFNALNLPQKFEQYKNIISRSGFNGSHLKNGYIKEFKVSNDELYLFLCNLY